MSTLHWDKLIVSLDIDSKPEIRKIIAALPKAKVFKVGLIPFVLWGPALIDYLHEKNKKVFLDLKFYDIPNTMSQALQIVMKQRIWGLTVHASNSEDALRAIVKTAQEALGKKAPLIIGVTQLTSKESSVEEVISLAQKALRSGLQGVVASAQEAPAIRSALGKECVLITPGIRRKEAQGSDDQKRVTTFQEALSRGSDFCVVGRPIYKDSRYLENAKSILSA